MKGVQHGQTLLRRPCNTVSNVATEIEQMIGATFRADRANGTEHVPISITNLDIDPAVWLVGRQKHWRILAPAFPAIDHVSVVMSSRR